MPRPKRRRRIYSLPASTGFIPESAENIKTDSLSMSLDEYESIRLIDYMQLSQEECAEFMGVARTTVQTIYNGARQKLALMLVEGKPLKLEGGSYELCQNGPGFGKGGLRHRCGRCGSEENEN